MKTAHLKFLGILMGFLVLISGGVPGFPLQAADPENPQVTDPVTPPGNPPAKLALEKIKGGGARLSLTGSASDQLYRLESSHNFWDWDTLKEWTLRSNAKPDALEWSDAPFPN